MTVPAQSRLAEREGALPFTSCHILRLDWIAPLIRGGFVRPALRCFRCGAGDVMTVLMLTDIGPAAAPARFPDTCRCFGMGSSSLYQEMCGRKRCGGYSFTRKRSKTKW